MIYPDNLLGRKFGTNFSIWTQAFSFTAFTIKFTFTCKSIQQQKMELNRVSLLKMEKSVEVLFQQTQQANLSIFSSLGLLTYYFYLRRQAKK